MHPTYRVRNFSLLNYSQFLTWTQTVAGTSVASLRKSMKIADKKKHNFPQVSKHCAKTLFSLAFPGTFSHVHFHRWFNNELDLLWNGYPYWTPAKLWQFELNLLTYPICPSPAVGKKRNILKWTWIQFAPAGETKLFGTHTVWVHCFHLAFEEQWGLESWMGLRNI